MQTIEKMRAFDPAASTIIANGLDAYETFMEIALHGNPNPEPTMELCPAAMSHPLQNKILSII